jgi:hypothetical protein
MIRYFRNNVPIHDQEVDSLWMLNTTTNTFELVDDDQYIFEPFYENDERFYEVCEPGELKNY